MFELQSWLQTKKKLIVETQIYIMSANFFFIPLTTISIYLITNQ